MALDFPEKLAELRKKRGLSQRQAASELYISQGLLCHYENGRREPGLDFLRRACLYYDVSADYLLGLSEDNAAQQQIAKLDEQLREARASAEASRRETERLRTLSARAIEIFEEMQQ